MATKKRLILENVPYHVTTRLVNRETWFNVAWALNQKRKKGKKVDIAPLSLNKLKTVDRRRIIKVIKKIIVHMEKKYGFKIYHFVLMDNHYHMICETTNPKYKLDRCMQTFNMMLAKMINKLTGRTGHVFASRYQSNAILDEKYGKVVLGYIYANPIVAGIVKSPEDHDCTSYRCYILTNNKHLPVNMNCPILGGEINEDDRVKLLCEQTADKTDEKKTRNKKIKSHSPNYYKKILIKKKEALIEIVEGYLADRLDIKRKDFKNQLKFQVLVGKKSFDKLDEKMKILITKIEKKLFT